MLGQASRHFVDSLQMFAKIFFITIPVLFTFFAQFIIIILAIFIHNIFQNHHSLFAIFVWYIFVIITVFAVFVWYLSSFCVLNIINHHHCLCSLCHHHHHHHHCLRSLCQLLHYSPMCKPSPQDSIQEFTKLNVSPMFIKIILLDVHKKIFVCFRN